MSDISLPFCRWAFVRAFLHRGYWMVATLYLTFDLQLSTSELLLIGVMQGAVAMLSEIPAGIVADVVSRKWAIVLSQIVIGASMIATGSVTTFPLVLVTQMIWGIGWTFVSGADVAWISDELRDSAHADRVLVRRAHWEQVGAIVGMVSAAGVATVLPREITLIVLGCAMTSLATYVIARFPETGFVKVTSHRLTAFKRVFVQGIRVARADNEIQLILLATFVVNGAAEIGRLYPKQLAHVGLPENATGTVWFSLLSVATFAMGIAALHVLNIAIRCGRLPFWTLYFGACCVGASGLLAIAVVSTISMSVVGVLVFSGISMTVISTLSAIWINRRSTSSTRATMQSFLAQLEYGGEIVCGAGLAAIARAGHLSSAFVCAGAGMIFAGLLIARVRSSRT